jgi:thioredoxin-related protein
VVKFVDFNFVPVQIEVSNTALMNQFKVNWTPTIIALDSDGNEVHRVVGFLPPEEFIPTFMVAKGKWYFNAEQHPEAQGMFDEALRDFPDSAAAAEAVFSWGSLAIR